MGRENERGKKKGKDGEEKKGAEPKRKRGKKSKKGETASYLSIHAVAGRGNHWMLLGNVPHHFF